MNLPAGENVLQFTGNLSLENNGGFAQGDVQPGTCTAKSTIYAASIAAGLAVHQFTRSLHDMPLDRDFTFNLLASELRVAGEFAPSIQENTFA